MYYKEVMTEKLWFKTFNEIDEKIVEVGDVLRDTLHLEIAEMDANASKFFKRVYQNTPRIIGRKR